MGYTAVPPSATLQFGGQLGASIPRRSRGGARDTVETPAVVETPKKRHLLHLKGTPHLGKY